MGGKTVSLVGHVASSAQQKAKKAKARTNLATEPALFWGLAHDQQSKEPNESLLTGQC